LSLPGARAAVGPPKGNPDEFADTGVPPGARARAAGVPGQGAKFEIFAKSKKI